MDNILSNPTYIYIDFHQERKGLSTGSQTNTLRTHFSLQTQPSTKQSSTQNRMMNLRSN